MLQPQPMPVPSALLINSPQSFYNEAHVSSLFNKGDAVVPLVGVYSTETHPFGLVYEFVDGHDLKQHLKNEPHVGGLKLVLTTMYPPNYPSTF